MGSNLALSFKKKYPKLEVIVLDNLKRRGSEMNITRLRDAGIDFVHGDIRNLEDFPDRPYSALIECSAEPSVLAGYAGSPRYVLNTNLLGTINCLEEARKNNADIIFLSSSRVYPYESINKIEVVEKETRFAWKDGQSFHGWSSKGFTEAFPLEGFRSIYGASKLCSEYILSEYIEMYGLRGVINRCGVIAGPWQFGKVDQGVFTLWMLAHYFKKEGLFYIGFSGKGKQVRDLLHVDDLFSLVDIELGIIDRINGKIYNVGGGTKISLSLLETTALCRDISGNVIDIKQDQRTRPADIIMYLTDFSRVQNETGWKPLHSARNVLEQICGWIEEYESILKKIL